MALLQSGKIYDIKIQYPKNIIRSNSEFLNTFINKYKFATGITDLDYSTIKSYYDSYGVEHNYFNLPYINDPLITSKSNLYLGFEFNLGDDSNEDLPHSYLIANKRQNNQDKIIYKYQWGDSKSLIVLKDGSIMYVSEGAFGPWTVTGPADTMDDYTLLHIDTRFLDIYNFYTINVMTFSFPPSESEESDPYNTSKIYFSPTTFIYDSIDQVTGKHYDSIFCIHGKGSINTNNANSKVLNGIGISFDEDELEQYENNSFYPQLYTKDENSIVLQKLQFGRLKTNNIYLTNRYKDVRLQNLTTTQKMKDYKDGWAEDILSTKDKKFLIGISGNGSYDYGNYGDDNYIDYQYIPVIIGDTIPEVIKPKLVPWSTGTDEEITAMINGYYNEEITIDDIKSVWKLGDKRKIHLNAMPASGIIEAHRAQDIDFEIIGFEHDTLTTPINGHTKALISLDQKDCLSDGQDGVKNTERGFMSPNNASTGTGWKGCERRTWCNTIYINAFPQYMQNLIKAVNKLTATSSTNSSILTTSDKGFLLSEIELFGGRRYSFAGEGTHYEYFTTGTDQNGKDKWKNPPWNSTSPYWYHLSGSAYWLRSPERNTSSNRKTFTSVTSSGNYAYYSEGSNAMFAPAICL